MVAVFHTASTLLPSPIKYVRCGFKTHGFVCKVRPENISFSQAAEEPEITATAVRCAFFEYSQLLAFCSGLKLLGRALSQVLALF